MNGPSRPRVYRNQSRAWPWTGCFPDGTCDEYKNWRTAFDAVFYEAKHGRRVPGSSSR